MLEKNVETVAVLLKSISHPLRLKILCLLQDQEMTVGDIRQKVKTSTANVSQHLAILRNQGLVESRKDGNFIYYRIADQRMVQLMAALQGLYCPQ